MQVQNHRPVNDVAHPGTIENRSGALERNRSDHRMNVLYKATIFAVLILFVTTIPVVSAGGNVEMERVTQGTLFYTSAHDGQLRTAPVLNTDVELNVTGFINRAHITQHFFNGSDEWVEGVYVFPLPENAAVDQLRIRIGDRVIEGQIKERATAKKIYEKAKAQGKRASLLEQQRPNIFTTSVANIAPHEKVSIEIEFQQVLRYDQGSFSLRFPMAITPRYIPGNTLSPEDISVNASSLPTDQVPDADQTTPLVSLNKPINPVSLHINLDAGFPVKHIDSVYHSIDKIVDEEGRYSIDLAEGPVPADRDFELVWEPEHGNAPVAAMFREQVGDESYYLMMMLPPRKQDAGAMALEKEAVYVIDTSGSMSGVSIRQARKALLLALNHLRPTDTFNIIEFNSSVGQLFNNPQTASSQNIAQAQRYVRGLSARGGTEMLPAMRAALARHSDSQRLRQVIFLTDGAIGNEDALFQTIRYQLGNSRLFTVGIGSAPNNHFMSKAAQFGRGTFTYIGDVNEVASKMQVLFSKLDSPVMRDLDVVQHLGNFDVWPRALPDLYSGEPLIFTAKSSAATGEVMLHGRRNGEEWQARFHLQGASPGSGIGKLWARNKIDALIDSLQDGADLQTVRTSVINLALEHHLVSKYTSLVAVDVTPVRPESAALQSKAVPGNLPHGQNAQKIFGLKAKTGTERHLLLLVAVLLLLSALMLSATNRYRGDA